MKDKHKKNLLEELEEVQQQLEDNQEQQEVIDELRDESETVQEAIYEAIQEAKGALEHLSDTIDNAKHFNANYTHEIKALDTVDISEDLETASKTATELLSQAQRVYNNDIDELQAGLLMIHDAASDRAADLEAEAEEISADLEAVEQAIKAGE